MNMRVQQQSEPKLNVYLVPKLEAATEAWYAARYAYQHEAGKGQQDAYESATNILGQAISHWQDEQPELAEQFGLWFISHQEVWSEPSAYNEH